jgi:2-oxoglutarate ferredoxin oxidoreductase subunit gamma
MRYEIRIAGEGGQGVILAAVVIAKAAGLYDDWYVAQTQSYGAAVRGGYSKAEVVISDSKITYQKAIRPDILVALNQVSSNMYYRDLKAPDGIFIVDSSMVDRVPTNKAIKIPFTKIARRKFKPIMTNMVVVGAITATCKYLDEESVEKAIKNSVPYRSEENIKAFRHGVEVINEQHKSL